MKNKNKMVENKFEVFFKRFGYNFLAGKLRDEFSDVVVASLGKEALDIFGTEAGYDLLVKMLGDEFLETLGRTLYKEGSVYLSVKRGLFFGDIKIKFNGIVT